MTSIVYDAAQLIAQQIDDAARVAVEIEGVTPRVYTRDEMRELVENIVKLKILPLLRLRVVLCTIDEEGQLGEIAITDEENLRLIAFTRTRWRNNLRGKRVSVRFEKLPT